MIEIFENLRKGGFGFRLTSSSDQRVVQGGVLRHPNPGLYEEADTLDFSEFSEAGDYLDEGDYTTLVEAVKLTLKVERTKSDAKAERVAEADTKRRSIEEEDEAFLSNPPSGGGTHRRKIKNVMVVRREWRWFIAFYKQRGYREHLAPCTLETLRAVIRGDKSLRYYKNSNRFIID